MGKPASVLGDAQSGHGCFPPSKCISASGNVITGGKGAMRVGDQFVPHCCGKKCHSPVLASGSSTVIINGRQAGRLGDPTACGAVVMTGVGNVLIGD